MKPPSRRRPLPLEAAGFALLIAATVLAYVPALRGGFIWDDDGHVTLPELRSGHGLWRIWFDLGATQQYYPVLHSAFWVEHRLWGDAPLGYHLTNVFLHAVGACLFVVVLQRLWSSSAFAKASADRPSFAKASADRPSFAKASAGRPSFAKASADRPSFAKASAGRPSFAEASAGRFAKGSTEEREPAVALAKAGVLPPYAAWIGGLLFALHPVCVESVAWISEQKNTLSTVFYLLAALAYLRFYDAAVFRSRRDRGKLHATYVLASGLFVLAVLSKSVTASLPAALLVVLWWRKGRLGWKREVLPLVPWFAAALGIGLLTAWVERTYIGAQGARFDLSAGQRVLLAGRVIWFYLGKLAWPADLIFIYPRWKVDTHALWQYGFPAGVAILLAGAWLARKRSRGPLAGLLFFVGTLFPALGFFNVYPFVFSYVADHFQYLASLGMMALVAAGFAWLGRLWGRAAGAAALASAAVLGTLTWRQCRNYRDLETFYRATVDRNPASWLAQENLGVVMAGQGRLTEAIEHYREALRLNPDYPETHDNYGNVLARLHHWEEAVVEYGEALRLRPGFFPGAANWARAEYDWGNQLGNSGRLLEAIAHYRRALRLRPDYAEAMADLGLAEAYADRLPEAVDQLRQAVRLRPGSPQAHAYLGYALARSGRLPDAVAEYRESLRLNPGNADVHYQMGMALRAMGQTEEAARELEASRRMPEPKK